MSTQIRYIVATVLMILFFGVSRFIIKLPAPKYPEPAKFGYGTCNDDTISVLFEYG